VGGLIGCAKELGGLQGGAQGCHGEVVESREEESWEDQGVASCQGPMSSVDQVIDLAREANAAENQLKIQ
jgi:hypothetical protein